jgi:hypothetical protein
MAMSNNKKFEEGTTGSVLIDFINSIKTYPSVIKNSVVVITAVTFLLFITQTNINDIVDKVLDSTAQSALITKEYEIKTISDIVESQALELSEARIRITILEEQNTILISEKNKLESDVDELKIAVEFLIGLQPENVPESIKELVKK